MRRRKRQSPTGAAVVEAFLAASPGSMRGQVGGYLEYLRVHSYSEASVEFRAYMLEYFTAWCEERGLLQPAEVTKPILERYQRHLFYYRKANGHPLGVSTQYDRLNVVRLFFRYLVRQNLLPSNPASELELPRMEKRLPKAVLSAEEAEAVLAKPDVSTPLGLRDRAMLETLYSTGVRRKEACRLSVLDVDSERGTVMVRLGKGKKDRLLPIGERALAWVRKYVDEARPSFVVEPDAGVLFLSATGQPLSPGNLSDLVRGYVRTSGIGKQGSCHLFRHTMATLMLEGGADIRFIQAMLGHAQLSSTELYTRVAIGKLKEIHSATHPGARLGRQAGGPEGPDTAGNQVGARDADEHGAAGALDAKAELLSSLAAETAEEERDEPS